MKKLWSQIIAVAVVFVFLAGCTVGPDFLLPDAATPSGYTAAPLPAQTAATPAQGMAGQRFQFAADLPGRWWRLFGSPELDEMIKQGIDHNPSLAAAQAALSQSEEDLKAVQGAILFPAMSANLQAARQRTSGNVNLGDGTTYNLYNTSVGVSYTFDIFGGGRRQIEIFRAQVDFQRYNYEAAYLTLTANIVTTAIQEGSLRAQLEATRDMIAMLQKQVDVQKKQFELGAISRTTVLALETELAITKAGLPSLEKQLSLTGHALSILVGRFPGDGKMRAVNLDSLHLPQELPVSLPSKLARLRPDIRASEELLHQACAAVGVATANLYPQITLNAGYGFQAISTDILFNGQSVIWNLGAGLLQPVFRGGELAAKRRSAIAAYDQAAAEYRLTVLKAFQEVADVLRSLEADARTLQAQAEAEAAAYATLLLVEKQYELGAVNYPALLIAHRDYQKTRISVIAAKAQRYADTAALFQSLGGGWWNRESASGDSSNPK